MIINGIYGHLNVLKNTLEAASKIGIKTYAMLGDVVGLGPEPNECINLVNEVFHIIIPSLAETILASANFSTELMGSERYEKGFKWTHNVLKGQSLPDWFYATQLYWKSLIFY